VGRFLARRILIAVPTLIGVTIVVFITVKIIPGNPVAALLGINAPESARIALEHRLGLTSPWPVQYIDWLKSVLSGNLGTSIARQQSVSSLVWSAFGNTAILAIGGAVVAVGGGVMLGAIGALRRGKIARGTVSAVSAFSVSAPQYTVGFILLVLLSVDNTVFPSGGMYGATGGGGLPSLLDHMILPSIAAGIVPMGIIARLFQGSLNEVLDQEFITSLRSRGLSQGRIIRHAIHNTLPSLFTIAGLQIGFLLGGVIFVETIFTWPGIGELVYQSITARDYPVIEGATLVIAVALVLLNIVVDAGHALIDPRVRS
jgi:peptide/nickel transport system permease protein